MKNKPFIFRECANKVRDKVSPELFGDVPFIGLAHIEEYTLHMNGFGSASEVSSVKSRFLKGDILFGKLRPHCRKVIIAPFDGICSTDIWVVRATNGIEQEFLYYWMASQEFADFSSQGAQGTKEVRTTWRHMCKNKIPSFTKNEQRAIANILGSLDDKIKINRRINKTLKKIIQVIFKSWFVDFEPVIYNALANGNNIPEEIRKKNNLHQGSGSLETQKSSYSYCKSLPKRIREFFPARFQYTVNLDPALKMEGALGKWIPNGWKIGTVGDLGEIVSGKTPVTNDPENYGHEVPFITIYDMHVTAYVTNTRRKLSKKGADSQKNKYIPANSICVSCVATPGLIVLSSTESQTNQQICTLLPDSYRTTFFCYEAISRLAEQIKNASSSGSVIYHLSRKDFENMQMLIPCIDTQFSFNDLTKSFFEKILSNEHVSNNLANLRDSLLNKLLSGKITIPKAENIVRETL